MGKSKNGPQCIRTLRPFRRSGFGVGAGHPRWDARARCVANEGAEDETHPWVLAGVGTVVCGLWFRWAIPGSWPTPTRPHARHGSQPPARGSVGSKGLRGSVNPKCSSKASPTHWPTAVPEFARPLSPESLGVRGTEACTRVSARWERRAAISSAVTSGGAARREWRASRCSNSSFMAVEEKIVGALWVSVQLFIERAQPEAQFL